MLYVWMFWSYLCCLSLSIITAAGSKKTLCRDYSQSTCTILTKKSINTVAGHSLFSDPNPPKKERICPIPVPSRFDCHLGRIQEMTSWATLEPIPREYITHSDRSYIQYTHPYYPLGQCLRA